MSVQESETQESNELQTPPSIPNNEVPENLFAEPSTFQDRLGHVFEKSLGTDVKFVAGVGENQANILAHKIILASASPVFYSMFFSTLESHSEILIPDCDPVAFKIFLQFLYTNSIPKQLVENKVADLLYIARKYFFRPLEEQCIANLREQINSEFLFQILELADFYMLPELTALCWEYIEENTMSVLEKHLETLSLDMLITILGNDNLNALEIDLFHFVIRWAKLSCEKNGNEPTPENFHLIAGPAFKLIRYPTMSSHDLANHIAPSKILSSTQIANIFTYNFATIDTSRPLIEFNTKPRIWSKPLSVQGPQNESDNELANIGSRHRSRATRRRAARMARIVAAVARDLGELDHLDE